MKLYSSNGCPQCERLKSILKSQGKEFEELDLQDPANLTDLRVSGIFSLQAPILVISQDPFRYLDGGQVYAASDQTLIDIIR